MWNFHADAGRTPIDQLCRMVEESREAGATTINIPDTVGYTVPMEIRRHHFSNSEPRPQY